jgi:hypothetical protein
MYVKLFRDMLNSTIWMQDDHVVRVWLVFLLMADQDGLVKIPIPALAMRSRTSLEHAREAVQYLESPDPDSQSSEEEGRRILRVHDDDPVWFIVNYEKYKRIRNAEDRREYMRHYMKDYRAKKKRDESVNSVNSCKPPLAHTETDADADVETETETEHLSSQSPPEPADKPTKKKRSQFKPPTVEEVQAYIDEKELQVDAAGFVDFYESKGWMVGKNSMKSWPAACRRAQDWDRNKRLAPKQTMESRKPTCNITRLDQLSDEDAHELKCRWLTASEGARTQMDPADFKSFVEPLTVVGWYTKGEVVVGCPNSIVVDWVNDHLLKDLPESVVAIVED